MTVPLLSYIVPSFNHALYLERLLLSLENQTINEIEVIVTDDGSVDNSVEIASKFAQRDPRFKVFPGNNLGIVGNRNRGLGMATADYVSFIDSDDEVPLNRTEIALAHVDRRGGSLIYGDAEIIDVNGRQIERFFALFPEPRKFRCFSADLWSSYCFVPSVSVVVDRRALIESKGFWGPAVSTDYLKWIELGLNLKVRRLDGVFLGRWRMHPKNTSVPKGSGWQQHYHDLKLGLEQVLDRNPTLRAMLSEREKAARFARCHFVAGLFLSAIGDQNTALEEFELAAKTNNSISSRAARFGCSDLLFPLSRMAIRAAIQLRLGRYSDFLIGPKSIS
jgi:glycosyltransferase involved in cell wall biosynthesis